MQPLAPVPAAPVTGPQLDNRRIAAALIDVGVLAVVALALRALTGGFAAATAALAVAWGLYYFFAFEWSTGQTAGKRIMGLRVLRADGGPAGLREIAVRTVLRLVDGFGIYLVGLAAMLLTGERRQRLGDLAAGTVVTTATAAPTTPETAPPAQEEEPAPEDEAPPGAEAPAVADEAPAVADEAPAVADEAPAVDEEEPAVADEAPAVAQAPPPEPKTLPAEVLHRPEAAQPPPEDVPEPGPPAPEAPPAESPGGGVKGLEVVSAIDLVMADADEDERSEQPGPPE